MKWYKSFCALVLVIFLGFGHVSFSVDAHSSVKQYDLLPYSEQTHVLGQHILRTKTIRRKYSSSLLRVEPSQMGNRIALGSLPSYYQPEQPIVPMDTFRIPLRDNETIAYIKTISMDVTKMPLGNIPLEIAQKPIPITELDIVSVNDPEEFSISSDMYLMNSTIRANEISQTFPSKNLQFIISGDSLDRYAQVTCFPVFLLKGDMYIVQSYTFEMGVTSKFVTSSEKTTKNAIIISPNEYKEAAHKLQTIQEKRGFTSRVVLLSELDEIEPLDAPAYPSTLGFLDVSESVRSRVAKYDYTVAFKLRAFLKEAVEIEGLGYLTILGDATSVPPSYYILSPDRRNSYDQWIPTDLFYASPHSKGVEVPIEIAVGRLPVRDKEEANAIVEKQKLYADLVAKDSSWLKRATIMAGAPFGEHFMGELTTSRAVNQNYFSTLDVEKLYRTENKFNKDEFMGVLEEGKRGFLWAFGHGSGEGLALEPGYANAKDLLSVPQKSCLPIVLSEACGNGAWDSRLADAPFKNNTNYSYPTSFSDAILLSQGAGIAYVGGARVNYAGWSMHYRNGIPHLTSVHYMDAILEYFMEGYSQGEGALGDWAKKALIYYADRQLMWGMNGANVKTYFGFTLQGDPTIEYPDFDRKSDSNIPVIQPIESQPLDYRNWPLFSIDDGQEVQVQSNEEKLRVVIADYTNMSTPFVEEMESIECNNGMHQKKFDDFHKKTYALRFITPDQKEQRIVFHGRYNYDVVVVPSDSQKLMRQGETRSQYATIRNDGIYPTTEFDIVCLEGEEELQRKTITSIPVLSQKFFYYSLYSKQTTNASYRIETQNLLNESNSTDNNVDWEVQYTSEPIMRVGVLTDSSGLSTTYVQNALQLPKLNAFFEDNKEKIEVTTVPYQLFDSGEVSFESLGFDVVVLYTNNFSPTNPLQSFQASLERFTSHGGVVLGLLCLGQSNNGVDLQSIQSFFGIDPEERFLLYRTSKPETEIHIQNEQEYFLSSYSIQNRYTVLPKGRNWHQIRYASSTELVGIDESGYAALLRNQNRWFYSGFLSDQDFVEEPISLQFFLDLLRTIRNPLHNVILEKVSIHPAIPTNEEDMEILSTIVNTSMMTVEQGSIRIGDEQVDFENLLPKETRHVSLTLKNQEIGKHTEEVVVDCQKDSNQTDNTYTLVYQVKEKDIEPVKPSLFIQDMYEFYNCMEIYGFVQPPGAVVQWNETTFTCNEDGSFVVVVDQKELDHITLVPQMEDIIGDGVRVHLPWYDIKSIEMHLHDARAVANGQRIVMQQPYQQWNQASYFPLRDVVEALRGEILWDSSTQSITILRNNTKLSFRIGEEQIVVNGETHSLRDPAVLKEGTTLVSVECIGYLPETDIYVYGASQAIRISSKVEIHHENPNVEILPLQTVGELTDTKSYLGREKYPMYLPTCIDVYQDELYVSSPSGIYHVQEESYTRVFEYPDFLYRQYPSFIQSSHLTNHFFFRMHQDYIIISLNNQFLIFDRSTSQLSSIIQSKSTQKFLQPIEYYSIVTDMEVYQDALYILDVYNGLYIFDLTTGELMSYITIPYYLYNFEIVKDTIYACSYWGSLVTLQMDGSGMQEFEIPLSYCYRLFMLDPFTCLIGTLQNPTKLYSFDLKTESPFEMEELDLSLGVDIVEKISVIQDQAVVLGYSYRPQNQIALRSAMYTFDQFLSPESKKPLLEKDIEEAQKDNDYLSHIQSLHPIPESSYLALEQGLPCTDQRIRLLDVQTGELKSISTTALHPEIDAIYATDWYNDTYSILFYHYETKEFWIRQFHISPQGSKKMIVSEKLQIPTSLFPDQIAVNETGFCVLDQYQSALYWFQWDGELTDSCKLLSGEDSRQIPVSFDQIDLDENDQVLILDSSTKGVFLYDTAGFLSFTPLASLPISLQPADIHFAENYYSLLDRNSSTIYSVEDHIVTDMFSSSKFSSIGCYSESEDQWFVYDEKSGHIQVHSKDTQKSSQLPLREEDITVFPNALSCRVYPNVSTSLYFSLSIPTNYQDITVHLPSGVISKYYRLGWGTNDTPLKRNSFSFRVEIFGGREFQEKTIQEIVIEIDSIKKTIPVEIQTVLPSWEFLNGSPLFTIGQACDVGTLCSLVKNDQIWLSLQDMRMIFDMQYTIEEDLITINTNCGQFTSKKGSSLYTYHSLDGKTQTTEETFLQPVGDYFLVRADIIFEKIGAKIHYADDNKELVVVEGWSLVTPATK
ncbi:MAG TPA: C25 family cysteine peptidase [Caldisericia bacterium]|nr:C25 family cysteine peptidase [Caldisericia bacterium]